MTQIVPSKSWRASREQTPEALFGLQTLIQGCLLIIELLNKTRIRWQARSPWRGHLRLAGRDQAKAPQKKGGHHEGNDRIQA